MLLSNISIYQVCNSMARQLERLQIYQLENNLREARREVVACSTGTVSQARQRLLQTCNP